MEQRNAEGIGRVYANLETARFALHALALSIGTLDGPCATYYEGQAGNLSRILDEWADGTEAQPDTLPTILRRDQR